jgi:hypothetical protein
MTAQNNLTQRERYLEDAVFMAADTLCCLVS